MLLTGDRTDSGCDGQWAFRCVRSCQLSFTGCVVLCFVFLSCRFIQNLSRAVKPLERGSAATYFRRTAPAACAAGLPSEPAAGRAGLGLRQLPDD